MRTLSLGTLNSHLFTFLFGLSLSGVLTFCTGDAASTASGQDATDLESRIALLESKIVEIEESQTALGETDVALDARVATVETDQTTMAASDSEQDTLLANATVTQVQFIRTWGMGVTMANANGDIQWNHVSLVAASTGGSFIDIVDDAANTRTKFVALVPCRVNLSVNWQSAIANTRVEIYLNGAEIARGQRISTNNGVGDGNAAVFMNAGDVLTLGSDTTADAYDMAMLITAEVPLSSL